ncbi:MAG: leader peptidase (prepilin peptidase) / N-methyltransferase [Solirubrobacteraceae bacterium]|jgi:leader peptidase (prepilin peptidase)/N-methyltransferase|nr:leader peptidase (prepilin peptidase) / N-methyltransferase [Solirubrobacteraceae bacterium]
MSTALAAVCAGVFGAVLGSFLNVVIWRLPRGESLVSPRSACPHCGTQLAAYENIPIVSWLVLRGRCRHCGEPISPRYPLVEALTAVLMALVPIFLGTDDDVWIGFAMVLILIPLTFIDLDHRILPNKITYPSVPIAIGLTAAFDTDHLLAHLIAGAAAFGFLFAAAWVYPAGMGVGDVKLAGVLGLFLGRSVAPALLIAFLLGTVVGIAVMAAKGVREGRKTAIPFGPFLAVGGLVGLYVGDDIVDWYLDTFTSG